MDRPMSMNLNKMMKEAQALQAKMLKAQEALGSESVEATAGGGAIKIVMSGHLEVQSVEISPEVVDPEDPEMLQDLVLSAVNEAIAKAQALAQQRMGALTGGMKLPGLL